MKPRFNILTSRNLRRHCSDQAHSRSSVILASAIVGLLSQPLVAANFYWDADLDATGNATSGTGLGSIAFTRPSTSNIWNTTDTIWWDGVSGSDAAVSAATFATAGSVAIFNGTGGTVNLSSNISGTAVDTIKVDSSGYIFQMDDSNTQASGNGNAGYNITTNALTGTGTATFQTNKGAKLTLNSAADQTVSVNIGSGAGNQVSLVKTGAGTLTWNGNLAGLRHSSATDTTVQVQGGTLKLGSSWTGSGTYSGMSLANASSTFDFNGISTTFGRGISGASTTIVTNSSATLSTVTLGASQAFSSTTDALITGNLKLIYSPTNVATNVLTLTNNSNTYSGGTQLNFGTLAIGADNALGTGSISTGSTARVTTGIRSIDANARTIPNALSLGGGDAMQMNLGSAGTGNLTFQGSTSISNYWTLPIDNASTSFTGVLNSGGTLNKTGTGTLFLSNAASTGTGGVVISQGTLVANKLANAGSNSAIGAATNTITAGSSLLTLNGGTFQYAPISTAGATGDSTDKLFVVGVAGGTLDASGTGALNFTNTGTQTPERASRAVTVNWAAGSSTTPTNGISSVFDLYVGMTVTGTNITPGTTITGISTQNRTITLSNPLGGAGNQTPTLSFGYGTRTMTLTGTNTDSNTIAGSLQNSPTSGGVLALTKSGLGTWVLGGANTYTGNTTINAGTLNITNASGLGGTPSVAIGTGGALNYIASADSPMATVAGSTLTITGGTGTTIGGSIGSTLTGAQMTFNGAVTASGAIKVDVFGVPGVTTGTAGTYTLVSAASGLDGGTYTLGNVYNNTNFTVSNLQVTGTSITVDTAAATPITAAYWNGSLGGGVWTQSNGGTSNWQLAGGAVVNQGLIPTGVLLTFDNIGTPPTNTTLGSNIAATGLVVTANNTGALNVSPSYALTLGASGLSVANGAGAVSIGTNVVLGAAQTWTNDGTNLLTVSGAVSGANNLAVTGTGNTTISGVLATGAGTLTKSGTGTVTLSGANTYTGATAIKNGTLALGGGNNPLSTGMTVTLGDGTSNDSGILKLDGSSQQLAGLLTAGTGTGNRVVNGNATAAILTINNASSFGGVLGGTGTNENNFAVIKSGPGALTLTAANTYIGGTSVTGGSLILSGANNRLSTTGNITVNGSGTFLDLGGNSQTTSGTVTLNRGTLQNGTLTSTTNAFESINNSIVVTAVLNGAVGLNTTGAGELLLSAANTYTGTTNLGGTGKIRIGNNSALGTGTLSFNGGTLELNATLGVIANAMTATSGKTFLLSTSGANVYNATFSGNLTGDATNGLTKTGTGGTITLSGTNTYGGDTTVSQGALTLSSSGQLRFLPGANGVSNKVTGAGTANLNGTLSINLANAAVANGNAWTLVNVTTRTYNLAGVTSINPALTFTNSSGVWSVTDGGNTWTFSEGDGVLRLAVGASSPYDTFASVIPNPADRDPTDDPDADGISNLAEFVLGGSPIVSSQSILPTQAIDANNIVLSYKRTDASELAPATTSVGQYSTDLVNWTNVTPVLLNENGTDADDMTVTVARSNEDNGKLFVRVRFVK